ncbi:MAG: sulfatase-like hydrolase/transferase [Planctomycetota bacterium]
MAGRMVHAMDAIAGRLLRQLEKLDIDQNTLVIFTGDNGTGGSLVSRLGDLHVRGGNFKNAQDRTRGVKSTEISARKDRD